MRIPIIALAFVGFVFAVSCSKKNTVLDPKTTEQFWRSLAGPFDTSGVFSVASAGHATFAGMGGGSLYSWGQTGNGWRQIATWGPSEVSVCIVVSIGRILVGSSEGLYYGSIGDTALTRATIGSPLFPPHPISFHVRSAQAVYAGCMFTDEGMGLYFSADTGITWTFRGLSLRTVFSIAAQPDGDLFVATRHGIPWTPVGDVNRSTDGGFTWVSVKNNLPDDLYRTIAASSTGLIFVGSDSSGMYLSNDDGISWVQVNSGLGNLEVRAIAVNSRDVFFAGTAGGVFRSTNNGSSWEAVNSGLTDLSLHSLALSPDGYLYAGTGRSGVFRSVMSTVP